MIVEIDNGNSGSIEIYYEDATDIQGWVDYEHPIEGHIFHKFDFKNRTCQLTTFTNGSLRVGIYRPGLLKESKELQDYWTMYVTLSLEMLTGDSLTKITNEYSWAIPSEKVTSMGFAELEQATYMHCPGCNLIIPRHERGHYLSCSSHLSRRKKK